MGLKSHYCGHDRQTADKSRITRKRDDAKPGIYNQTRADQDRPADRKAKPGKPGDAKSWV